MLYNLGLADCRFPLCLGCGKTTEIALSGFPFMINVMFLPQWYIWVMVNTWHSWCADWVCMQLHGCCNLARSLDLVVPLVISAVALPTSGNEVPLWPHGCSLKFSSSSLWLSEFQSHSGTYCSLGVEWCSHDDWSTWSTSVFHTWSTSVTICSCQLHLTWLTPLQ